MHLLEKLRADHAEITAIRRDIHAHPELAFEEHRTAALVAERLRALGIETHTGVGKTGVVGILKAGNGSRSIGLRADMDALPIQEKNDFNHHSRHPGRMHACGHDGHTAMLLGAAAHLAKHPDFDGTVVFLFQPAEEGEGGAPAMIADGLFERFPMEAVFGLHNWPGLPLGEIAVHRGPVMACADRFDIEIKGHGAHAASAGSDDSQRTSPGPSSVLPSENATVARSGSTTDSDEEGGPLACRGSGYCSPSAASSVTTSGMLGRLSRSLASMLSTKPERARETPGARRCTGGGSQARSLPITAATCSPEKAGTPVRQA